MGLEPTPFKLRCAKIFANVLSFTEELKKENLCYSGERYDETDIERYDETDSFSFSIVRMSHLIYGIFSKLFFLHME